MAASTNKKVPLITVLGSLNIDLVSYVSHHPLPGETMQGNSFNTSPGGKGANQAVACAKLSRSSKSSSSGSGDEGQEETAHIRMVGALGSDAFGTVLLDSLSSYGVDVSGIRVSDDLKTGVALIVVDEPTGQNRIILSPEANFSIRPDGFSPELPAPRPDLLIMQLEIPLDTVLAANESARRMGVPVLLNPAPAVPLPEDAFRGLAHLVVNETEAGILGGLEPDVVERLATDRDQLAAVGRRFLDRGVQNVIITLGGHGVYYATDANGGAADLVPAEKGVKVVDTTAAGDTFVGQYSLAVVAAAAAGEPFDIAGAVLKANRAAAKTVEKLGAQISIPWRDEL